MIKHFHSIKLKIIFYPKKKTKNNKRKHVIQLLCQLIFFFESVVPIELMCHYEKWEIYIYIYIYIYIFG